MTKIPLKHYIYSSQIKVPGKFRLRRGFMLHEPDGAGEYNKGKNSCSLKNSDPRQSDDDQSTNKDDYDSPWKEALDFAFKSFVALYIPDLYGLINWDKGYIPRDGELQSLSTKSKLGSKTVDKLMQVHMNDGTNALLLIHIEVEHSVSGEAQLKIVGARMLEYYMFLALKHPNTRIYSIALVIDMSDSAAALLSNLPGSAADELNPLINTLPRHSLTAGAGVLDCSLKFSSPIVNLKGWLNHEQTLETLASTNPFAVITLAQLAALKYKKDKTKRLKPKMALVRKLQGYGYKQDTIVTLFRLIDWLLKLPDYSEEKFNWFLINESKEQYVRYVTPFERFAGNRAKAAMLLRMLNHKFSSVPESIAERLENANQEQIESWSISFIDAKTLDDVFKQ